MSVVTLEEAKLSLRVDHNHEDTLINGLISAAEEYVEVRTNRVLETSTKTVKFDNFSDWIELSGSPLQSVSTVSYVDTDGDTQTLADTYYDVDVTSEPGIVTRAYGQEWPTVQDTHNAVTITYVSGYTNDDNVPDSLKTAINLLVGHWYVNREEVVVGTVTKEIEVAVKALCYANWVPGIVCR